MTWQFWTALSVAFFTAAFFFRREIINRRLVREYLASLWIREMNAIEAERRNADHGNDYGNKRHLFGIAQGYREARHEAERFLRRDW